MWLRHSTGGASETSFFLKSQHFALPNGVNKEACSLPYDDEFQLLLADFNDELYLTCGTKVLDIPDWPDTMTRTLPTFPLVVLDLSGRSVSAVQLIFQVAASAAA